VKYLFCVCVCVCGGGGFGENKKGGITFQHTFIHSLVTFKKL